MAILAPVDIGKKIPQRFFEGLERLSPADALFLATQRYNVRDRYKQRWGGASRPPRKPPTPRIQAKLDAAAPLRVDRRPVTIPTAVVRPVPPINKQPTAVVRPVPPINKPTGGPKNGFLGDDPQADFGFTGFIRPPAIPPPSYHNLPPIAKIPKLPKLPPLPPPPLPPSAAPGAGLAGSASGGGGAPGGILLVIGLALLASFGKR